VNARGPQARSLSAVRTAVLWLALAGALAGCATVGERRADALSGRLSVHVETAPGEPQRAFSADFELLGDAESGRLSLSTPLGTVMAQARWSPQQVLLVTPQGQTPYTGLAALTRELLGEALPVAALFDWLRGRPWPGAESQTTRPPEEAGFLQLGWQVTLARFDQGLVVARRIDPPAATVHAWMDRP
jgi:outer membrane lipoprotein LolB